MAYPMRRPRNAFEAAIDRACGITESDYAPKPDPRPVNDPERIAEHCACVCSLPFAKARACAKARGNRSRCACACHRKGVPEARARLIAEGRC